jgi:Integrase core domain
VKSPQTDGICERFHKVVFNEFYRGAFRKQLYSSLDGLQADLDAWLRSYSEERPHAGRYCYGKTPVPTWRDARPLVEEKLLERQHQPAVVQYDGQPAVA